VPRAAWNTVIDVWTNDGSDGPDTFRFTRDARLVSQNHIDPTNDPEKEVEAYFTYSGPSISPGSFSLIANGWEVDWSTADLIHDLVTDTWWKPIWVDLVVPRFGAPAYRRAHVVFLY